MTLHTSSKWTVICDSHVHIYDCFNVDKLFDATYDNFNAEMQRQRAGDRFLGILLLAETSKQNWFRDLREVGNKCERMQKLVRWRCGPVLEDDCALLVRRTGREQLLVIAGRQVVTAEGLEVLALATDDTFNDGTPLIELLRHIRASGAISVIPWGVGKWLGHRGRLLSEVLQVYHAPSLFLGDNGGRPVFWRNPPHFQMARKVGIRILPGTDPLPLPREVARVGSFGFILQGPISTSQPAQDLRGLLRDPHLNIRAYGRLQRPYDFLRNQIDIRIARGRNTKNLSHP